MTLLRHSNSFSSLRSRAWPSSLMLLTSSTSKESLRSRYSARLPTLLLIRFTLMMKTSDFSKSSMYSLNQLTFSRFSWN